MVFTELSFLFVFLPVVLAVYYLCPTKIKNLILVLASLVFYAWGEPKYVLVMLASIVINYVNGIVLGKMLARERKITARVTIIVSVIENLGVLTLFKYAGPHVGLALPIGISFYTFQIMSYLIDVYRRKVNSQKNFINFAAYVTMFPQLIAGPIVRYKTVDEQLIKRVHSVDKFAEGIRRFIIGLAKKVLLANVAGGMWEYILDASDRSAVLAWLGALGFAFQIYFDFSGYSDMAIGLGKMFGFDYEENFDYPYIGKSITEFWRRWHISLSTWFKEYVYIPLGGNQKGILRQIINIFIVWTLTGIWHGASFNFMVWGMYFGVFLILEKLVLRKLLDRLPAVCGHIYMLLLVLMGWVLFAIDDWSALRDYLGSMFGSNGFAGKETAYIVLKYLGLLMICVVASTPLFKNLVDKILPKIPSVIRVIVVNLVLVLLLLVSVSLVVGDSYNPFLYFRF